MGASKSVDLHDGTIRQLRSRTRISDMEALAIWTKPQRQHGVRTRETSRAACFGWALEIPDSNGSIFGSASQVAATLAKHHAPNLIEMAAKRRYSLPLFAELSPEGNVA